jgi:cytochrome c biogenesis protein CcdA
MTSMLLFGLLLGMRHALEADHVAAVATLVSRHQSGADALRHGLAWGLGHTITLLLFGSAVLWMDGLIPAELARWLELLVGVMLVGLGLDVLRRLSRERVHFHVHQHGPRARHFHAHSHAGEPRDGHDPARHRHEHAKPVAFSVSRWLGGMPLRALFIGLMHGMAGSAALILLTLESIDSAWAGLAYMALFGLGSMVGMGLLSVVIALPLRRSAQGLTWFHNGLQVVIGSVTVVLGVSIVAAQL